MLRAEDFLARHGMPGKKAGLICATVNRAGALQHRLLHAADVGDELMRLKDRSEPLQPFKDREGRASEKDYIRRVR